MDKKKDNVLDRLIEYCDKHGLYINTYPGVVEPGYDDKFMVAANWNKMERIRDFIERYFGGDVSIEWSDEWTGCTDCGKAFRTSPDCHAWLPYYVTGNDGIMCGDCAKENIEDVLAEFIDSQNRAIMDWMMPEAEKAGFICALNDPWFGEMKCKRFQTGWHPGQNDTPQKALEELYLLCDEDVKKGRQFFEDKYEYLFAITGKGQFDIDWTVLIREREVHHE